MKSLGWEKAVTLVRNIIKWFNWKKVVLLLLGIAILSMGTSNLSGYVTERKIVNGVVSSDISDKGMPVGMTMFAPEDTVYFTAKANKFWVKKADIQWQKDKERNTVIKAIVYTTNAGHTKSYAEILSRKINLPVFSLKEAKKSLPVNEEIIYLGWLMAGTVKGLKQAGKRFSVKAVCGVGMSGGDSQIADMRKKNSVADSIPVFYLQGGFEMDRLHGIYKLMMKTMQSTAGKQISGKADQSPEEKEMLDLLVNGGNKVSKANTDKIIEWYQNLRQE